MIESSRMSWAGNVACMRKKRDGIYDFGGKVRRKETARKT
jgi:hypothetical protein